MKISVCILTKNSEKTIEKTLQSVKNFDEIIIIDDYSEDNTLNIAKKFNSKVYKNKLNNNFSKQRNFALSKTSNNWVLFLDSDEYLSKNLITEINNIDNNSKFDGFLINRQEIWLGEKLKGGEWGNNKLLRLAKKGSGDWKRSVHEYWDIKNTSTLKNKIIHQPSNSIASLVSKINEYSKHHARENRNENKKSSLLKVIFYPLLKFKLNFFAKLGFRDGTHGFVYAVLMSFHSFLSWADLWISQKKQSTN